MNGIARTVQCKGRLRPSFFFCLIGWMGSAWAQPAVYRCGHEYTNAPADAQRCERLDLPAVTVIPGTRAQAPLPVAVASATVPNGRADAAPQKQRDEMARTIVVAELDQARQRHAQLLREWQGLASSGGGKAPPQAQALQAAIERTARDIDSLQRELARKTP